MFVSACNLEVTYRETKHLKNRELGKSSWRVVTLHDSLRNYQYAKMYLLANEFEVLFVCFISIARC